MSERRTTRRPSTSEGARTRSNDLTNAQHETHPALQLQRLAGNRASRQVLQRQDGGSGFSTPEGELVDALIEAGEFARDLAAFRDALESTAATYEEMGSGFLGIGDDESALVAAKRLSDAAGGLANCAELLDKLASGEDNALLGAAGTAYDNLSTVLQAAELVRQLHDDGATRSFLDDPSDAEAAAAWGRDAADTFTTASELVSKLPGGVPVRMMAGYLRAPANYVEVFIAIMQRRERRIEELTDRRAAKHRVHGHDWIGPLSPVYAAGTFNGLAEFMSDVRHVGGVDLERDASEVTVPHLRALIEDAARESTITPEKRDAWLPLLDRAI